MTQWKLLCGKQAAHSESQDSRNKTLSKEFGNSIPVGGMSLPQGLELKKPGIWEGLQKNQPASGLAVAIMVALDRTQTMHLRQLCVNIAAFLLTLKQNRITL